MTTGQPEDTEGMKGKPGKKVMPTKEPMVKVVIGRQTEDTVVTIGKI